MDWQDKKVAILGWGVDTQDVAGFLEDQGAVLTVLDEKKGAAPFGDLAKYDVLVRSPGVYRYRSEILEAEKMGVKVTSKTKIFFDVCPAKIIGVTGTKGKGTTSTLIYKMLKAAGKKVVLGGNIGVGLFEYLSELDEDSYVVMELSSFQLIDLHKSPEIAVVLMVTADHLDWHKNLDEYLDAKANIVRYQKSADFAVINKDYKNSVKVGEKGDGQKVWISGKELLLEAERIRLRGEHNRENIAAALAVAQILKIDEGVSVEVIENFRGLEHRLEEVETVMGATYFDDSFSTTPETTMAAIKSFFEPIILIAGGSEKGSDFTELGKLISETENIKAVILIGMMAERIEASIENKEIKILKGAKNMREIVQMAKNEARPGDVVLLSPAAASFDMFANYKDRGDQFKAEVKKLIL